MPPTSFLVWQMSERPKAPDLDIIPLALPHCATCLTVFYMLPGSQFHFGMVAYGKSCAAPITGTFLLYNLDNTVSIPVLHCGGALSIDRRPLMGAEDARRRQIRQGQIKTLCAKGSSTVYVNNGRSGRRDAE